MVEDIRAANSIALDASERETIEAWRVFHDMDGPLPPSDSLSFASDPAEHPDYDRHMKILPVGRTIVLSMQFFQKKPQ